MRRILTALWALLICLGAHAQITRNIWGLTLGQSTAAEIRNTLRERGYGGLMDESTNGGDRYITVDNTPIQFGGGEWNRVMFAIRNGRLSFVIFSCDSKTAPQNALSKRIDEALNRKYSSYRSEYKGTRYKNVDIGNAYTWIYKVDYASAYQDGRTEVTVVHSISTNYYNPNRIETKYSASLCYSDKNLGGAGSENDL